MQSGDILRIIMVVTGLFLLGVTVSSLARRKMTEPFCLTWGLISVMIILAGILLRPVVWNRYISGTGMLLILMVGFCVIYGACFMSTRVSELMRKNLELAMQVSLINQENEELRKRLDELEENIRQEKQ